MYLYDNILDLYGYLPYNVISKKGDKIMITYKNNEQVIIEIKKLMIENNITQKNIADKLGITPQSLTSLFNKKNFGFEDAKKILNVMGFELVLSFDEI